MPAKPYSLTSALGRYNALNIFRSPDLYVAILATVVLSTVLVAGRSESELQVGSAAFFELAATMSAAILGLVLAAFAIMAGLGDSRVLRFLADSENALSDIIALFWYVGYVAGASAFAGLAAVVLTPRLPLAVPWLVVVCSFLTSYSLFAVVGLVRTVAKLTLARVEVDKLISEGGKQEGQDPRK